MWPSQSYTSLVMLRSTVSPVVKAAEMIRVLSMRPMTMSSGLGAPAGDVAHAHLEHDAVAQGNVADRGERQAKGHQEDEHDRVHGDAEETVHGGPF